MDSLLNNQIRQRKKLRVEEVVREFDTFNKVVDSVKEEQTASNGIITVCCFVLILVLSFSQLYDYWFNDEVEYKFAMDTAFDERPVLDLDMIVNTPCNGLNVMIVSHSSAHQKTPEDGIAKEPSRFEMDQHEQQLWDTLRQAHQDQFKPGTKFKALNMMNYVSKGVETGLRQIAKDKVREEEKGIVAQRKADLVKGVRHESQGMIMLVGNGMGMFQLIANNGGPDEGRACRLSGKIPVLKGDDSMIVISPSNIFSLGGLMGEIDSGTSHNFSHRIERFHFGDHIWGLVTPLAGTEKMSASGNTMYKYYVKVVPTRIVGFMGKTTTTYQYSVTSMSREPQQHGHVGSGITFVYEFDGNVIYIYRKQTGLIQLLLRLCSVIGGVFATSVVLQHMVAYLVYQVYGECRPSKA